VGGAGPLIDTSPTRKRGVSFENKMVWAMLAAVLVIPHFAGTAQVVRVSLVLDGPASRYAFDKLKAALAAKNIRFEEAATLKAARASGHAEACTAQRENLCGARRFLQPTGRPQKPMIYPTVSWPAAAGSAD
jgi:hypothetical protein